MTLASDSPHLPPAGPERPVPGPTCRGPGPGRICRPLSSLTPGEVGTFCRIDLDATTRVRLADLGFVQGTQVEVVRTAPLGDPLELHVRGTDLCLRKEEAQSVWVHPLSPLR
jgi:Fe2+ transport system protein FeoA